MKRILAVQLRPLRDAVLAGPCFEALREAFPKAWITALIQPPAHELYQKSGWVNEVVAYHRGAVNRLPFWSRVWKNHKLVNILQKRYFDLAVDFSATDLSSRLVTWSKAPLKVGLGLPSLKSLYDLTAPAQDAVKISAVELYRRVLGLLGLEPKSHDRPGGFWPIPEEAREYAATFWKANRFAEGDIVLALNPFSHCETKEWYPAKWAEVIKELLDNGLKLFMVCRPWERTRLEKMEKESGQNLPVYAGNSLAPLMGLYQKATAFLGVESGFQHLAAAVGTPTVTIWGPEAVSRWHPYSMENHPVVIQEVPCRPCGLAVCVEKKHECMVALQAEDVLKAVKKLLKRSMVV